MNQQFGLFPLAGKLRQIFLTAGYPSVCANGKTMYVHRIVMANKLGRNLVPGEVVHHKDGNRFNFYPDNLEIMASRKIHVRHHGLMLRTAKYETLGLTKRCCCCGDLKLLSNFYRSSNTMDGAQAFCKKCSKKNFQKWVAKRKASRHEEEMSA